MSESFDLERSTRPITFHGAGVALRAPGLVGRGTYEGERRVGEVRESTGERTDFDEALAEAGLEDRHTIVLQAETPLVGPRGEVRAGEEDLRADEIELEVVSSSDEYQFLTYQDEDGVMSFHFPSLLAGGETIMAIRDSGQTVRRYRLQLRPPLPPVEGPAHRGWLGEIGNKILKVIIGKVAAPAIGAAAYGAVWIWEERARSFQGFHGGASAEDLLADRPLPFVDWPSLAKGRSLLFLHGTTSTTAGAFAGLNLFRDVARKLYKDYDGRIVGFNHHTLSRPVAQNVVDFYKALPPDGGPFEFDVICHSRGGLVARALKELSLVDVATSAGTEAARPSPNVAIRRVVFVATPNNGTELAEPGNIPKTLDRLATLVNLLPDSAPTIALGAILAWAGYTAEAGLKALPGLRDQVPESPLLRALNNAASPAASGLTRDYWAVQSDYEPLRPLIKVVLDAGIDRLFEDKANDLIVPTLGVSKIRGTDLDPERVKFFGNEPGGTVMHTRFFVEQETWHHIARALP